MKIKPHNIIWTRKKIAKFWQVYETNPTLANQFYSKEFYEEILYESRQFLNKNFRILDIGFGNGTLFKLLDQRGFKSVFGIDVVPENVMKLQKEFPTFQLKVGEIIKIPFENEKFDVIFATEVIEHLLKEDLIKGILEMHRVLKSDGYLIITTPYAEKIVKVVCPDCQAIFEPYQHLQRFDKKRIYGLFQPHFQIVLFKPIRLLLLSFSPGLRHFIREILNPIMNRLFEPGGNLLLILKK